MRFCSPSNSGAAGIVEAEMMRVEFGFHAAGMRRENEDAAADEQALPRSNA